MRYVCSTWERVLEEGVVAVCLACPVEIMVSTCVPKLSMFVNSLHIPSQTSSEVVYLDVRNGLRVYKVDLYQYTYPGPYVLELHR